MTVLFVVMFQLEGGWVGQNHSECYCRTANFHLQEISANFRPVRITGPSKDEI